MNNKELFYFTGKCLLLDEDPGFRQDIIEKIATDSIDWQMFVTICSNHLVLPVVYLKFYKHDIIKHLPEELAGYLKDIYDLNASRNNQILLQLHDVTGVLNKGGIYPVFLKGAGNLLDKLYSDIGERMLGDVDFLVPEKDWLRSVKLLKKDGYSESNPNYGDNGNACHYPPISKSCACAHLEIHRFLSSKCQSWFNRCIIEKEKKSVIALKGCYVLSDNHKIIHNFIHSQIHHGGHSKGMASFRNLYDLYLLSKRADLQQAMTGIKSKRKAIAYFAFTGKAFGLNESFFTGRNVSSLLYIKKHDLNLSSATFYYTYRSIVFISHRIFIGYIGQLIKSIYSKEVRKSLINRLSDRQWYSAHLNYYRSFFSPNKKF